MRVISRDLRTLFSVGVVGAITDGTLLERFIAARDEAAFEALVVRHGPMVWGVCRRVLGSHHDAEDAFQATFLVLARKAATILRRETVASWLYAVAYQTALKARTAAARRRARERQVTEMPEPTAVSRDPWLDLEPLLDQELSRLPDAYRGAVVLCDLEGKSRKEAAQELGWPEGTLSSRLARGRGMLSKRLARHGLTLSGGAIAAALSQRGASAAVTASLVDSTVQAAALFVAGPTAAAGLMIPAQVASLAQGMLKTMLVARLKVSTAVILALGLAGSALATGGPPVTHDPKPAEVAPATTGPDARAPLASPPDLVKPVQDTYQVVRFDRASRTLTVRVHGPARGNGPALSDLHLTLELARDVRASVNGVPVQLEDRNDLRPGVLVNLWIDRNPKGNEGLDARRSVFGVVTRIDVLADQPRLRRDEQEIKLDSSTVLQGLKQAVEAEFDAASSDDAFDRFWKDALAKLHHTHVGNHEFVARARDCKSCHSALPAAEPTVPNRLKISVLNDLNARQREELVRSVTVARGMQSIRNVLETQRKLVPDSQAAVRALDEIEQAVRALKQTMGDGSAKPAPASGNAPSP